METEFAFDMEGHVSPLLIVYWEPVQVAVGTVVAVLRSVVSYDRCRDFLTHGLVVVPPDVVVEVYVYG